MRGRDALVMLPNGNGLGGLKEAALRAAADAHPNLTVVGAAVAGTGLAQVVPDARRAALGIRRERFAVPGTPWPDEVAVDTPDDARDDERGDA